MMIMPGLRRHVFEPLHYRIVRSNRLRSWKALEKTQFLPEETLRQFQWQRLQAMLDFVSRHNRFYQHRFEQAGLSMEKVRSVEEFQRAPILTKAEIRENTPAMISSGFQSATLQKAKTGGSTGKALSLYFTERCSELRNAAARRHDRWTGWEPGEPIAGCWGNPKLPRNFKQQMKKWFLQPVMYLDTMVVNEASIRAFIRNWRRLRPTLLFGHSHSIFLLAKSLQQLDVKDIVPKGILCTSMMLFPHERKTIAAVFGVNPIDRYGCEEVGLIGCECEKHEGMHLNIEHLFIEFLKNDGSPAMPGEPGRIVVTDLINFAMPLIRYQVEDIGVPTHKKCSCGRGLPLMAHVTGRVADFMIKQDGTRVAGVSLIENTLTRFPGIDQMQIVQHAVDRFEVRVVPGSAFTTDVLNDLETYLKSVFGANVSVAFPLVDQILPERSGKFRFSICKVNSDHA